MKVRYFWTEDGGPELCEHETHTATEDLPCYHCGQPILTGSKCVKLHAPDGERYTLHERCAEESICFYKPPKTNI